MRKITIQNKKGDIPSLIYAVIILFVIGIILVFFNKVNLQMYDSLDQYLNNSKYAGQEAQTSLQDIKANETSHLWDYMFLMLLFGIFMAFFLTAYATRISVMFFWIYGVMTIVVLILAVVLSNSWQELAENPEFTSTIARFPITNLVLGSYFPMVIMALTFIGMILLFGKSPEGAP